MASSASPSCQVVLITAGDLFLCSHIISAVTKDVAHVRIYPWISQTDHGQASWSSHFWVWHSLVPCLKYHFFLFCLGSLVALDGVFTFRGPFFAQRSMTSPGNSTSYSFKNAWYLGECLACGSHSVNTGEIEWPFVS